MLALTHILIIYGLIVLPAGTIDTVIIVGQRAAGESFDPMRIALPVLYGIHWCAWCISLVCLVSLRLSARDPIIGFEIQDPKQTHSLEMTRIQSSTSNNITPRNQHLFNFRQSVISPLGSRASSGAVAKSIATHKPGSVTGSSSASRVGPGEGPSTLAYNKGKETARRYSNEAMAVPQAPTRTCTGKEKRASTDTNAIYIPSDPRISQVVVTFREGGTETRTVPAPPISYQRQATAATQSQNSPFLKSASEATTIYITNHNYGHAEPMEGPSSGLQKAGNDRFTINFSSAGESLSDMIFKSSKIGQTHFASMAPTTPTSKQELDLELEQHEDEPLKRNRPHANETDESRTQNFARIRATETKASLTLSSDSSSGMSAVSNSSSSFDGEELEESQQPGLLGKAENQEGIVVRLAMVAPETGQTVFSKEKAGRDARREHHDSLPDSTSGPVLKQFSYPTIPRRQSSHEHTFHAPVSMMNLDDHSLEDQGIHPHDYIHQSNSDIPDDSQPAMQPNSSDSSHSLSSMSTKSTRSKNGDDDHASYNYAQRKPIPAPSSHAHEPPAPASTSTSSTAFATHISAIERNSTTALFSPPLASAPVIPSATTTFTAAATAMTSATPAPTPGPRPKSSLASLPLRYWRDRNSGPSSCVAASIAHGADSSTSSSFAQSYLASTFSKKKKLQIPTIVIHPDEEDGEPPRVLSQKDIEYLSTMPPAPLRPLIQPWDDFPDEDDPDHMINEGYDFDDLQQPVYHRDREMGGIEEEDEEEYDDEEYGDDQEHEGAMDDLHHDVFGAPGFDPYALDVPIDLPSLEHGDIKAELQDV